MNTIDRKKVKTRLKFYADDVRGTINGLFTWGISAPDRAEGTLLWFLARGFKIRAAFIETVDQGTREILNNKRIEARYLKELAIRVDKMSGIELAFILKHLPFDVPIKEVQIKNESQETD